MSNDPGLTEERRQFNAEIARLRAQVEQQAQEIARLTAERDQLLGAAREVVAHHAAVKALAEAIMVVDWNDCQERIDAESAKDAQPAAADEMAGRRADVAGDRGTLAVLKAAIESMDLKMTQFHDGEWVTAYVVPAGPWHHILGIVRGDPQERLCGHGWHFGEACSKTERLRAAAVTGGSDEADSSVSSPADAGTAVSRGVLVQSVRPDAASQSLRPHARPAVSPVADTGQDTPSPSPAPVSAQTFLLDQVLAIVYAVADEQSGLGRGDLSLRVVRCDQLIDRLAALRAQPPTGDT